MSLLFADIPVLFYGYLVGIRPPSMNSIRTRLTERLSHERSHSSALPLIDRYE